MEADEMARLILYEFTKRNYNNIELPAEYLPELARAYLDLLEAQKENVPVKKIFSGKASEQMWQNINNLGPLHNCEDVADVLYEICCKMQELEDKIDRACERITLKP